MIAPATTRRHHKRLTQAISSPWTERAGAPLGLPIRLGLIRELRMNQFMDDQIKAFIVENFFFGDTRREIGINDSLIENDIIDSTGILELVAFVEDQYNIRAEDSDITPANFDSIANLRRFIMSKTNVTQVA